MVTGHIEQQVFGTLLFRLMICVCAIDRKDQTCIKLNHWNTVCPGKWRVSHLLNNFSNFTQTKDNCQFKQHDC